MATQSDLNLAQSLYIAYYGRAADQSGLEFWADKIEEDGLASVLADFGNSAEFQDRFGDLSNEELVDNLYQQLFNRSAEQEGQDFWVGKLESGELNLAEIAHEILQGAQEVDQATLDAKLAAANEYTETAGDDYDLDDGTAAVENAEADQGGQAGEEQALTQRADDLSGTSGDDVFTAPVTQNETGSGELANTFETGDKIDGGEGTDSLEATMIASGAISGAGIVTPPINAETTSVENVFLTAQQSNLVDTGSNPSPILGVSVDAGKMSGVEQWWSDESRADILVEDIRSNPADTAFGMRDTDPGTSFSAYFNANYLEGGSEVGESAFNFTIREQGALGDQLNDITVNGIRFELNGETYQLDGADVEAANTWAELQAALQADIDATEGLEGLTVEHQSNGQFVVKDPAAGDFVIDPAGTVISSSTTNEVKDASLGVPEITDLPTETDIFLDGAGNGSEGGGLDVGTMSGDRGVEVFNTTVVNDSHVAAMQSSNLRTGEQYLQEVLVEGEGDLTIGTTTGTFEDRAMNGLTNVRVLDASELDGSLNAGIVLDTNAVGRYLDDAEEAVDFQYTGTVNDDMLNIKVNQAVAGDPDFAMQVDAGAGDDLINLTNNSDLRGVSLEGGDGEDTLETASDIGVDADSTPADFANIEHLVLTGNGTDADMDQLPGVESVTVSTNGGNSTVSNLEADTTLTISGERQTQGNQSNFDQSFGTITLTDAQATSQLVELDNTARVDGQLSVAGLTVDGNSSSVRNLTLNSSGERSTANAIAQLNAAAVSSLELTGSQDLSINVNSMATAPGSNQAPLDIDASDLDGDLNLALNGTQLNQITGSGTDTIEGTAGDNDELMVHGAIAGGNAANVTGIEAVQFGTVGTALFGDLALGAVDATGTFDVANVAAGEFNIANVGPAGLTLDNLGNGAEVNLGDTNRDANGDVVNGQILNEAVTLDSGAAAGNPASELNVDLLSVLSANQTHDLTINGYNSINLDVAHAANTNPLLGDARTINLDLDADARSLTLTGGDQDGDNNSFVYDSLTLGQELPNTLTQVDLTDYAGEVTMTMEQSPLASATETDVTFRMSEFNADITLTDLPVQHNSKFIFTDERGNSATDGDLTSWSITNAVDGTNGDLSVDTTTFDVSELGITAFTELDIALDGADTIIRSEDQVDNSALTGNDLVTWEIRLVGVDYTSGSGSDLNSDNFITA